MNAGPLPAAQRTQYPSAQKKATAYKPPFFFSQNLSLPQNPGEVSEGPQAL